MKETRERIYKIIQIGGKDDVPSRVFDYFIVTVIFVNLFTSFFSTFDESAPYMDIIIVVEYVSAVIFTAEYILRLLTADFLYPEKGKIASRFAFVFSFYGIVDLLTFLPMYIPEVSMGGSMVAFRILRIFRILRLFRINSQYDAFCVITDVLKDKKDQIISSVSLIFILMLAASMGIYSLEHDAQPDQYRNAFSGLWWSVSTLLTVGYGDIYPITVMGKIFAIFISFLGVGMVAIPTGIISAGFVEYYTEMKEKEEYGEENAFMLYQVIIKKDHEWVGRCIKDLNISQLETVVLVERGDERILPPPDFVIKEDDKVYVYDKEQDGEVGTAIRRKRRKRTRIY